MIFSFRSLCLLLGVGVLLVGCPTQPSPPPKPPEPGSLSLVFHTATAAWLHIQVPDSTDPAGLRVYRGEQPIADWATPPGDTVIQDHGLLPQHTYQYQTRRVTGDAEQSPGDVLEVTTLDTTADTFTWSVDTLGAGNYGSSYLKDVAIINDHDIWAVGEIYVAEYDSAINSPYTVYNAVHWDGTQWHRILIDRKVGFESVFALSARDIWFSDGCQVYHYDGVTIDQQWECDWETFGIGQAKAIWGTSASNLFFVGNGGTIIHYDGQTFTKMHSGTDEELIDISGRYDESTGEWQPWVAGEAAPLVLIDGKWELVGRTDRPGGITTVHPLSNGGMLAAHWNGFRTVFSLYPADDSYRGFPVDSLANQYVHSILGTSVNDLLFAITYTRIFRYNGARVQKIPQFESYGDFVAGAWKENTVCLVGWIGGALSKAIIVRGERH